MLLFSRSLALVLSFFFLIFGLEHLRPSVPVHRDAERSNEYEPCRFGQRVILTGNPRSNQIESQAQRISMSMTLPKMSRSPHGRFQTYPTIPSKYYMISFAMLPKFLFLTRQGLQRDSLFPFYLTPFEV